jgi:hypothetical protein
MGEARRRGTREQRYAESVERNRLEWIERERQASERRKWIKFRRIKHEIETRHLRDWPTSVLQSRQRRRPLTTAMILAMCVSL